MQKKCKILQIKIQNSGPFKSFTSLREWGWRCARDGVVARSLVVIDLRSETKRKGSRFESGC